MTAPFDYLIVVFLSNSFYQNYLELSFSISTEFGAESLLSRNYLFLSIKGAESELHQQADVQIHYKGRIEVAHYESERWISVFRNGGSVMAGLVAQLGP